MDYNSIEAKIVVLGSTGVGKTSIVVRYVGNGFNKYVSPTIGASFFTCKIAIDCYRVKLQVWDTAGQERFRSMAPMYYRKANAALLVYDITSMESYKAMQSWTKELMKNVQNKLLLCVIGNKCDLAAERVVPLDEAQDYAASIQAFHFETSAATSEGIEKVFLHVAKSLIFANETDELHQQTGTVHQNDRTLTLSNADHDSAHKKSKCCS